MVRTLLALVLALVLALPTFAADLDGVIVSYDPATNKLVVEVAGKERTIEVTKSLHVHDTDGKRLKAKDELKDKLKKGVKVEIEEKDGAVVEVILKK